MTTILVLAAYFLPWIIAALRRHHNQGAIFVLNLLLGWTILGWIVALVWSATAIRQDETAYDDLRSPRARRTELIAGFVVVAIVFAVIGSIYIHRIS